MDTKSRRQQVLQLLKNTKGPVTGSNLAKRFNVSRQIIVGDISVLRAGGITIYATPQGYFVNEAEAEEFDKTFPHKEKLKLPGQLF